MFVSPGFLCIQMTSQDTWEWHPSSPEDWDPSSPSKSELTSWKGVVEGRIVGERELEIFRGSDKRQRAIIIWKVESRVSETAGDPWPFPLFQ